MSPAVPDSYRQTLFSFTYEIQFQQAVNPVNPLVIPYMTLPMNDLKKLLKTVSRIALSVFCECFYDNVITPCIRFVEKYRPAR